MSMASDTILSISPGNATAGPNPSNPGNAITGGYMGDSFAVRALIIFFSGLSLYNAVELILLIFFTFSRFHGLYFYSLLVSSICVIPYSLGFLFKLNMITTGNSRWLAVTLITIGWYGMVTGQSVVLWSRLHLLMSGAHGEKVLRWTKWMIIVNAVVLHIPTTVLTYGSNGDVNTAVFVRGYNVMEKIQMSGFFVQEVILSALYIRLAAGLLRNSTREDSKKFFVQLVGINVLIIIMDLGLLATEAASLYLYETIIKGTIYSIKLKLEFAILGKLVHFAGGRPGSQTANEERWRQASVAWMGHSAYSGRSESKRESVDDEFGLGLGTGGPTDVGDFVNLSMVPTHATHVSNGSRLGRIATTRSANYLGDRQSGQNNTIRTRQGVTEDDVNLAQFEHAENTHLPAEYAEDVDCHR